MADIAGDDESALKLLGANAYDIAVLDRDMPILMLTAADRLDDKLAKPFELQELVDTGPEAGDRG